MSSLILKPHVYVLVKILSCSSMDHSRFYHINLLPSPIFQNWWVQILSYKPSALPHVPVWIGPDSLGTAASYSICISILSTVSMFNIARVDWKNQNIILTLVYRIQRMFQPTAMYIKNRKTVSNVMIPRLQASLKTDKINYSASN